MKKQTKVLLAAAALTLGASFTAMAAETYDWKMEDGQWVCYDEDGDVYDNEWVKSAGKDYYAGDDGVLVTNEWVDGFYVRNSGEKTINDWKFVLPEGVEEDDDDAEAKWFYFGSKGKFTTGKKVIDGVTYYFNAEGEMLTGWINYDKVNNVATAATEYIKTDDMETVYVNADGSRAANMWIKSVEPGVDEEEVDEPDYFWYYIQSKGTPKTGRALDINGETYFFNAEAQMLTGWVGTTDDLVFTSAEAALNTYKTVYYCGSEDQGWARKSAWINEYRSTVDEADVDEDDMYWFWADSKGKVLKAAVTAATDNDATKIKFAAKNTLSENGNVEVTTKEINGKDYIFNQDGEMLSGLVKTKDGMFYYGASSDGSMKTGEIALEEAKDEEEYTFFFAKTKKDGYGAEGAAVTGAAAGKLYKNGILVTHDGKNDESYIVTSVEIDGKEVEFVIDENGNIKTSSKEYKKLNEYTDKKEVYLDTTNYKFATKADGNLKGSILSK